MDDISSILIPVFFFNSLLTYDGTQCFHDINNKLLEQGIVMKKQDKNNNLKQYIPSKVPNHVLLNEYTNGKGISPHQDGPLYDSNAIILSLNVETPLTIRLPIPAFPATLIFPLNVPVVPSTFPVKGPTKAAAVTIPV